MTAARTLPLGAAVAGVMLVSCGGATSPEGTAVEGPAHASPPASVRAVAEPDDAARDAACEAMAPHRGCYPRVVEVGPCSGADWAPGTEPQGVPECRCDLCAEDGDCAARPNGRCRQLMSADDICEPNRRVCAYPNEACYADDGCDRSGGKMCLHRGGRAVCSPMPDPPP